MRRALQPQDLNGEPRGAAADHGREAHLLRRVACRDLRAFEELYRIYHPRLSRFLGRIISYQHLIEDALDDTMMVVWDRPLAYDGTCKVSTWIFAIAYRTALKALRRSKEGLAEPNWEPSANTERDPEERLGDMQVRSALINAIGALSADHRAVVDLAYFHEFDYREIAQIMECPVDTVKTRVFHARRNLKKLLGEQRADWI